MFGENEPMISSLLGQQKSAGTLVRLKGARLLTQQLAADVPSDMKLRWLLLEVLTPRRARVHTHCSH